jgi:hypothetical protein
MSQYRRKNKNCVIVDLADKHHVALTRFKRQSYFHLRHNSNGKTVSFNLADMQSLVDNFALMKRKLNKLKQSEDDDDDDDDDEPKKKKKQKRSSDEASCLIVEDDEEDDGTD